MEVFLRLFAQARSDYSASFKEMQVRDCLNFPKMEEIETASKSCIHCNRPLPVFDRHCSYCGGMQPLTEDIPEEINEYRWVKVIALFYGINVILCGIFNLLGYFRGLQWLIFTQAVLASLTVIFVFASWKNIRPVLQWKSFSVPRALAYGLAAIFFAIIVNVIVKWVNVSLFGEDIFYYRLFRHLEYPRVNMIIMVAAVPALFEELGYRGVVLHGLLQISAQRRAVFIAAFLFAIIHMSFISFFWLMPFAIWLGNVRVKEKTIWYGVLIHFCFNCTACVLEFYELKLV